MSFTNINDLAGVKALLDQLRSSPEWQATLASAPPISSPPFSAPSGLPSHIATDTLPRPNPPAPPQAEGSGLPTVADLLAQLRAPAVGEPDAFPGSCRSPTHRRPGADGTAHAPIDVDAQESAGDGNVQGIGDVEIDVREMTFQQALPRIAALAEDAGIVDAIRKMKEEQVELENKLWMERLAIQKDHEGRVKTAMTKASILGEGLTSQQAAEIQTTYREELSRFDRERVLGAVDRLVARQQATFEKLGVPTMYVTTLPVARKRQDRVMQILEGIVSTGG